jgi:hypothetical protein
MTYLLGFEADMLLMVMDFKTKAELAAADLICYGSS